MTRLSTPKLPRPSRSPGRPGEAGFALVVVILVVLLASFLASQLILEVRTELAVSHTISQRVTGRFLAQAGLNLALFRLLERPLEAPQGLGPEEDWESFAEGYEYEVLLPEGRVTYYVVSESGKIDLNRAPQPLLRLFLEYALGEGSEEEINTVLDSLADWRDNDDLHRENGAESEYYDTLANPHIARNGNIREPSEFFLVRGTRSMATRFPAQEVFTVHNPDGKINFNSLTPAMLDFLTGGDKERAAAYREAKREYRGLLTAALAAEILGERYGMFQPYLSYAPTSNPFYYLVGSGAAGDTGQPVGEGEGDQERPRVPATVDSMTIKKEGGSFSCLAWQERFS